MKKIFQAISDSNTKQKFYELLPYFIIVLIITLPWFFKFGYLFFMDMVWGPNMNIDFTSSLSPLFLIINGLGVILPFGFLEKMFVALIFFLILLAGRKIASNFTDNKWLVFISSLFGLFNPFVYDRAMYGQFGLLLAFGLLAYAVGYLIDFLISKKDNKIIIAGIFIALSIMFSPHFLFFGGIFSILFFLLYLYLISSGHFKKEKILKLAGIFLALIVLINAFWIIGLIVNSFDQTKAGNIEVTENDLYYFRTTGENQLDALKNVVLMVGFWGENQNRYVDLKAVGGWWKSFCVILPIIILGFFVGLKEKRKELRYLSYGLLIVFILSIILALGIRIEFLKKIMFAIFHYVPLYKVFREPQKWVAMLVIIYQVFLTFGLTQLAKFKIYKQNSGIIKVILGVLIIMQAPLMLWGLGGQIKPAKYPADWLTADKYITEHSDCQSKTLILPWHMYLGFDFTKRVIANPTDVFFTCPVIRGTNMEAGAIYDNSGDLTSKAIVEWIDDKGQSLILQENNLNIGYIILLK
ncbi:hypothetical protein A2300_02775, partial [Candidatus Falkowbacteria bacterium RIFOXYB2_FULL_35_7]